MGRHKKPLLHRPESTSPLAKYVNELSGRDGVAYFLVGEAADIVGRSTDTLTRWRRENRVKAPSVEVSFGGYRLFLYTEADIRELQAYAKRMDDEWPR